MSTERLFPPRCCSREIPSEIIFAALTSKEKKQYISKSKEYTTLPAERWYCPKANCARWIHPKYIISKNASQKCPYCKTQICSTCRRFAHNYSGCGYNAELAPLLKQARRSRWQRCYHCGEMVESLGGCQHIHCRCGADFCYGCGNQWQSEACVCSTVRHVPDEYLQFDELRNEEAYLSTVIAIIEDSGREEINENRRRAHGSHLERKGESFRSKEYRKLEIDKRIKALSGFLSKANKLQQMHLINRQKEEGLAYFSRQRAEVERFNQERRELTGKQDRNLNARTQKLLSSQTAEIKQMKSAHDEEEIALVARLPRLFKHQSNAEDREMAVVTKLRGIQETEKKNLILEHTRAMREADEKNSLEREALLSSLKAEWDTEQLHARTALQSLVQGFIYDRYWFDRAVAKREDMLAKYRLQLINSRSGLEELTFVEAFGS
ncbi:IBR domain-containing protein [Aspergillus sclerotialis]|uniref:RBR-type E3 ubiquitin transferase n=1 Tax=Aspergillus sclerotialis TaxID=2070753 RepID=A0A3A3ADM2_9EURO|nr:IBR domain-containing protein [Aspergillus sclerotialis]